jgi:Kef-type K+ transport system membrane component KefB
MKTDGSFLQFSILTLLGGATIIGFYAGRLANRINMPKIIGYMALGIILGPSILNIFEQGVIQQLSFVSEIGLGFVAFTIGSELSLASLKRMGSAIVSIILAESLMAFLLVAVAMYAITRDLPLSIIFGAMAPATAPAGTVAVIQEYKAKGSLTKTLYAVVGLDDSVAVVIYGFAAAIAKTLLIRESHPVTTNILPALASPILEITLSLILGGVIGIVFSKLVGKLHHSRDILIIIFGVVLLATGLSIRWHLSFILSNMMVGLVLVNNQPEAVIRRVRTPLNQIMPLVFLLFFCLAGTHLEISVLTTIGGLSVVYITGRSAGKIAGACLGACLGRVEKKIKKYLGFALLSQAGVAIGLSLIVMNEFTQLSEQYHLPHAKIIGVDVLTTITATCIFFEIIGPILTKFALTKAGEISIQTTD